MSTHNMTVQKINCCFLKYHTRYYTHSLLHRSLKLNIFNHFKFWSITYKKVFKSWTCNLSSILEINFNANCFPLEFLISEELNWDLSRLWPALIMEFKIFLEDWKFVFLNMIFKFIQASVFFNCKLFLLTEWSQNNMRETWLFWALLILIRPI